MPTRSKSSNAAEIARIEELISDLTQRLNRLNGEHATGADGTSIEISDFVADALETIIAQIRESADTVTGQVADHAAKAGTDAIKRVVGKVEHHPLATLAVVAGVGFILGTARR